MHNILNKGKDSAFIVEMTDADYRKSVGLAQSSLKEFMHSPAHYLASIEQVSEPTKAMNFGSAFHASVLLDDPFSVFAIKKKVDGRSKEGKAYNDNFALENANKIIIDDDDYNAIQGMKNSIMLHKEASEKIKHLSNKEVSVFGTYIAQEGDIRLKGLIDGYSESGEYALDLKSCEDASPAGFRKAIWDYRYDIQNCHYWWLLTNAKKKIKDFYFIAVEKKPPYAVGVYRISPDSLIKSFVSWELYIEKFAECQKTGNYPAYSPEIVNIVL